MHPGYARVEGGEMSTYRIELVNHTQATPPLQGAIQTNLQSLFNEAFEGTPDS